MIQNDGLLHALFGATGLQPTGPADRSTGNSLFSTLLGSSMSDTEHPSFGTAVNGTGLGPSGLREPSGLQEAIVLRLQNTLTPEQSEALRDLLQRFVDGESQLALPGPGPGSAAQAGHKPGASMSADSLVSLLQQLASPESLRSGDLDGFRSNGSEPLNPDEILRSLSDQLLNVMPATIEEEPPAALGTELPTASADLSTEELQPQWAEFLHQALASAEGPVPTSAAPIERLTAAVDDALAQPFPSRGETDSLALQLQDRRQVLQQLQALLARFRDAGGAIDPDGPNGLMRPPAVAEDSQLLARFAAMLQQSVGSGGDSDAAALGRVAEVLRAFQQSGRRAEARVAADAATAPAGPTLDLLRAGTSAPSMGAPQFTAPQYQAATHQTFERVVWMVQQGAHSARLQLDPPELGRVDIRLEMDGPDTRIQLLASQAGVRDALESMLPRLRDALGEQGLNLADASVSDQETADSSGNAVAAQADEHGDGERDDASGEPAAASDVVVDDGLLSAYA